MAVVIKTDGSMTNVEPENGSDFKRLEICGLIQCDMVQIVRLNTKEEILVVDEEGLLNEKGINSMASDLFKQPIVGDVLMCDSNQVL